MKIAAFVLAHRRSRDFHDSRHRSILTAVDDHHDIVQYEKLESEHISHFVMECSMLSRVK